MSTGAHDWQGCTLKDRNGEEIGTIDALHLDQETDRPEWALVDSSFVPLAGASPQGADVVAAVEAQQVKDAPRMDTDDQLSERQEAELFRHYGVEYNAEGDLDH